MARSVFYQMSRNFKKNSNSKALRTLAYAAIGGFLYPIFPTLVQGFSGKDESGKYRIDMSGWKGVLTGGIATTLIGMLSNKMEIAYGGFAAMVTHVTYVKANDTIASFTGSPIFAFDKTSQIQNVLSDGNLPAGMEYITLPDGSKVLVSSGSNMSDYTEQLSDYTPVLADYTAGFEPYQAQQVTVNDYTEQLSDFYSDVANGKYS